MVPFTTKLVVLLIKPGYFTQKDSQAFWVVLLQVPEFVIITKPGYFTQKDSQAFWVVP